MREPRNAYYIMVGKRGGKRPLGRPMCRLEDNIRIDLNGNRVESCGLDSSGASRDKCRVEYTVMNVKVKLLMKDTHYRYIILFFPYEVWESV
jgi:hypothetical protein